MTTSQHTPTNHISTLSNQHTPTYHISTSTSQQTPTYHISTSQAIIPTSSSTKSDSQKEAEQEAEKEGSGDDLLFDDTTLDDYSTTTSSIDISAEDSTDQLETSGDDIVQWKTTQVIEVSELPFRTWLTDKTTQTKPVTTTLVSKSPPTDKISTNIYISTAEKSSTTLPTLKSNTTTSSIGSTETTTQTAPQTAHTEYATDTDEHTTATLSTTTSGWQKTTEADPTTASPTAQEITSTGSGTPTTTSRWWWRPTGSPSTTRFVWWWTSKGSESTTTANYQTEKITSTKAVDNDGQTTRFIWWWTTKPSTATETTQENTTPIFTEESTTSKFVWWWTSPSVTKILSVSPVPDQPMQDDNEFGEISMSNNKDTHKTMLTTKAPRKIDVASEFSMVTEPNISTPSSRHKSSSKQTTTISNHVQDNLGMEPGTLQDCDRDKSGICDIMDEQKCRLVLFKKLCCRTCILILHN